MMNLHYFVFAFVLYLACGSVVFKLKRRNYFWLKLILSTAVYFVSAFLWCYFKIHLFIGWFKFVFLIFDCLCILIIYICFKTNIQCAVFYATIGYTIEHISSRILGLAAVFIPMNYYGKLFSRLFIGICVVVVTYFLVIRKEYKRIDTNGNFLPKKSTFILSLITVLFIYVLSMYADSLRDKTDPILVNLCFLGQGILLLIVQFGVFNYNRIKVEKSIVSRTMELECEQHKQSKEIIDLINVKCHDLKNRIDLWRNTSGTVREEQLRELEDIVKVYEAEFRTGRAALDAILTEKALYCNKFNIQLVTVINGEAVGILKDEDIFSLFGNILDNAIEYLSTVEDVDLRVINLNVVSKNKLLVVHSENYCSSALEFKGGLPVTTKTDKENHGFGMLSISHIVEKYKGALSVKQEGENFVLNIIIPL